MTSRIVFLIFLSLVLAHLLVAQNPVVNVEPLIKIANEKAETVDKWESAAQLQMALVIAGIVCGGLIAVLQPWGSNTWCKVAAGVLGIVTAVVTGLTSKAPVNYSEYQKSVLSARGKIGTLRVDIHLLETGLHSQDQEVLCDDFTKTVKEISQIESKLSGDTVLFAWLPGNVVYAQSASAAPAWNATLPTSASSIYFRGEGISRSLSEAKTQSFQKAVEQGAKQLSSQSKNNNHDAIAQYIIGAASVADSSLQFDRASGVYHYYTLLKMDKSFTRPGVFAALSAPVKKR